jgi:peptide/nickel transport system substrate-binding protein
MPFNTQLGMVLVHLALRANPPVHPDPIPSPRLVIAHPNSSAAANASAAIARMWTEIGVETLVRKLKPGESIPTDDEWDFLYLEVSIEEPLTNVFNIIGSEGFATEVSAPIEQTLRNLSYAESWRSACSDLRRLHRQTSVDLSLIPLWQVQEHFAYRNTVREIGRDLIHLYQNVDRWKIDLSEEEELQEK